jgi:alpha-D-xyloside xylohydrolase
MSSLSYAVRPDGLYLQAPNAFLLLTPYTSQTIRVRCSATPEFSTRQSLMVVAEPQPAVEFRVVETEDALLLATAAVTITIDKESGAFAYQDKKGNLLVREPARGGKTLVPADVVVSQFDDEAALETGVTADGVRVRARNVRQVIDRQAYHTKLAFEWSEGEALYGLGSHEEGMLNLRGQHQFLYQQNMKAVVPVLVSTRGYGILLDAYSLMTFHDDAFGSYLWTEYADELDFYFAYGPELDQVVAELRYLTGAAPLFPKWAYGYVQSKERYASQAELVEVVNEYRRRELPLDCIVLDWRSWVGDLWGQKTLDPQRFPDPGQMMADLHARHVRLMVSIWPIMKAGGENWQEMHDAGYLLGNQATYDAFNPAARSLYWQQALAGLFRHGIDAWWCDCTEPFEADWTGAHKPEPEERLRINAEEARRYLDPQFINAYSLLHSQGIFAGQRAVTAAKRVLNLTRSAYMGQHRYAAVTWSGDVSATWETLRRQIADGLNFCATGSPYWTLDVGGFFVQNKPDLWFWSGDYDKGVADPGYRELFVRWFQYATFLPMLRAHGTDTPREIWRFGEPGDGAYDALVRFLKLRYQLLPYIYSLAGWTTHRAYTMLRLLAFDFRDDPCVYDVRNEFLFGPAFLVCPITEPMDACTDGEEPRGERTVYLPAGCDWYNFWTGGRLAGGQTITASANLGTLPIYVRAGAIVPMTAPQQYVDEQPNATVELHIYPGQNGAFQLYEDAGDGYDYEHGAFATINLHWDDAAARLTIGARSGEYPGMQRQRDFIAVVGSRRLRLGYSGRQVEIELPAG